MVGHRKALLIVVGVAALVGIGAWTAKDETAISQAPASPGYHQQPSAPSERGQKFGEYTCRGAGTIAAIGEVDEDADIAEARAERAIARRRKLGRRLDALSASLKRQPDTSSQSEIDAYNAKVDEHNAVLRAYNAAGPPALKTERRYNSLARLYNRMLEQQCEKD